MNSKLLIPRKTVVLEDGTHIEVETFCAQRTCVTVGDFRKFQMSTGYVTTAEQNDVISFKNHYALEDLTNDEINAFVAVQISWLDASAYCQWAGGRLISEAEWLSASVRDWNALYPSPRNLSDENLLAKRQYNFACEPLQMVISGPEWTSLVDGQGLARLRNGPRYFLVENWMNDPAYAPISLPKEFYNDVISFRVCFDAP